MNIISQNLFWIISGPFMVAAEILQKMFLNLCEDVRVGTKLLWIPCLANFVHFAKYDCYGIFLGSNNVG